MINLNDLLFLTSLMQEEYNSAIEQSEEDDPADGGTPWTKDISAQERLERGKKFDLKD